MKKHISFYLLLFAASVLNAQRPYVPTPDDLDKLVTTTTYVVLEPSPLSDFNMEMKEAMPREWKLTNFDYITLADFPEKSKDPAASFIYTTYVTFDNDKTESRYIFLHLSLGGDNVSLNDLRDIISIPLGYAGVDPDHYNYKLGLFVRFMQKHINMIKERPELISSNVFKHYNDNMADVKDKTLYLIEDELAKDVSTAARIKAVYPYKFKLVERDEIKDAITVGNNDVVFLHKVGPEGKKLKARCYKILIGAGNADFYYFNYHMVSAKNQDGFLSKDFKKLAKSKKK